MLYFAKWKIYLIAAVCLAALVFTLPNFISRMDLESLPGWVPQRQITLGLDLRGGSYLLLEVDMPAVIEERLESLTDEVRTQLRQARIGYTDLGPVGGGADAVAVTIRDMAQVDAAVATLRELNQVIGGGPLGGGLDELDYAVGEGGRLTIGLSEAALREKATGAVEQSIEIVRRRIDETGVNEPSIARQGQRRILVQLPGVDDPDRIKRLLGRTAKMTFHLLHPSAATFTGGRVPPGAELLESSDSRPGLPQNYLVRKRVEVDGGNLTDARAGTNPQTGEWVVNFEFDSIGARRFGNVTRNNVGRPFAIVLDDRVISAPVIREPILGGRGQISGGFTVQEANDLAVLLRAGALPAPLTIVEERTVGPDLGADAIRAGVYACIVGFFLVIVYMAVTYGIFGLMANVALMINMVLVVGLLSVLQATLTLPGIAGLLLTLGMAVDANILIIERIREEYRKGRQAYSAMDTGFQRAFGTILDSNITTLITMVLLYSFGSGPVRGFAVTISCGILTSMFSAMLLSRLFMVAWLRRTRAKELPV